MRKHPHGVCVKLLKIKNMLHSCVFDKVTDIVAFQPGCSPDVNLAISSGVIPDTTSETSFNGLDDLSDIGHRVCDPFDVIEYDRAYSRIKANIESKKQSRK